MPAVKRSLTDSPEARPYIIKGMLGGMMTPRLPATAIIATQNFFSYPRRSRMGRVMLPTAATVATPEPEMAP